MTIKTKGDKAFDIILYLFMALVVVVTIYPIWYITIASFSSNNAVTMRKVKSTDA